MSKVKYQQIFAFLKDYYQLREPTVRDITTSKKYVYQLWLPDIAQVESARYRFLEHDMEEEALMLTVKRPKSPEEPEQPEWKETWKAWLDGSVFDLDSNPEIREIIEEEGEIRVIDDCPGLKETLLQFLTELSSWKAAQKEYVRLLDRYKAEKAVYDKLFDAANKLDSFSERFELLLGVGLFTRKASPAILRPLVTIPMEIQISDTGIIRVLLAASSHPFQLETEFLSGIEGFSVSPATGALEERLKNEDNSFWDTFEDLKTLGFEAFASRLSTDVTYRKDYNPPTDYADIPTVTFTPVILFRERSLRGFTVLFESIIQFLGGQGDDFQLRLLDRIVYSLDGLPADRRTDDEAWPVVEEELVLPKTSNQEQMDIARRIGERDVVLVQGPPGTGKSHTIANIITYLLSQGKRILVTAQTDQALKALRQHLPEEFLDLVIYFLQGAGRENDLARSVRNLQDSINSFDEAKIDRSIEQNRRRLRQLREERSELINGIQWLQQADRLPVTINDQYRDATIMEIVERVNVEMACYDWMKDEVDDLLVAKTQAGRFFEWNSLWQSIYQAKFVPDGQVIPEMNRLPLPEEIKALKEKREHFQQIYEGRALEVMVAITPNELRQIIGEFNKTREQLSIVYPWQQDVQAAYEAGDATRWDKLAGETRSVLSDLKSRSIEEFFRNYEITIPEGVSARQFKSDVFTVLEYTKQGRSLSGISKFFLPRSVKACRYIYEACRVNNRLCSEIQELELLYQYSIILFQLSLLDEWWTPFDIKEKDIRRKFEAYQTQYLKLKDQLIYTPGYLASRKELTNIFQKPAAFFEGSDSPRHLDVALQAYQVREAIQDLDYKVQHARDYLTYLAGQSATLNDLKNQLESLSHTGYELVYHHVAGLVDLARKYREMLDHENTLSPVFKETIRQLRESGPLPRLERSEIEKAIFWSNARHQLGELFSESLDDKFRKLKRNDEDMRDAALAYLKGLSTKRFMENLYAPDELGRQLTRWSQAVNQAGGRGRLAFRYRLKAQEILQKISEFIPCWIMPIYRLVDTLGSKPETFDVVIVDEASQLGPEALFLKYITKKIIVVGDDQQTAPENVGVEIDQVDALIRRHLNGIPDKEFFSTKHSFFDHVDAISGKRISLKEHFRCMPEIIEFSNQLCYEPQGIQLIPLKQYNADRLRPLETFFVRNGTYEGERNIPEAMAIVNTIKYLLREKEYKEKTFGIIALQGTAQSVEIDRMLRDELTAQEFLDHKILCGTPPDFQGDERDVIFLSLVTAPDHRRTSLTRESFKRRYNVAMSRAKEQVWLFHSVHEQDLNPADLRYKLLHYFNTQRIDDDPYVGSIISGDRSQKAPKPFESWFEVDIYREMVSRNYKVYPQFKVGAYRIDLVVQLPNGKKIAVECDGDRYHEGEDLQRDIERQLVLERAGWEFFRVRWSHYKYTPEEALRKLWVLLEKRAVEVPLTRSLV